MRIRKFQEGGMTPEQAAMEQQMAMEQQGAMGPEQGMEQGMEQAGPEEQLVQVAQDIIGQMGPEMAMMLAQIIMQMLEQGGAPQEQPVFAKRGGRITRLR